MAKNKIIDVPRLIFTDKNCHFGDLSRPGVGLLIDVYGKPVYPVIDWLIMQRKKRPDPEDVGTIKQQAYDIRMFWEFLQRENRDWKEINDNFLLLWRDRMSMGVRVSRDQSDKSGGEKSKVDPIAEGTINRRLSHVVRFYIWCSDNGLVPPFLIGHGGKFRITLELNSKGKRVWPNLLTDNGSKPQETPTHEDVDEIHESIDDIFEDEAALRNRLYVDWERYLGMRGIEAASLMVDMIPSEDVIEKHIDEFTAYPMDFSPKRHGVKTKGNKDRLKPLDVDPMLLKMTRNYIDFYRPEIVERAKKRFGRRYKEPRNIFLAITGDTMGQGVRATTMQNAVRKAIAAKGLKFNPHGLRRLYAMSVVENLYIGKYLKLKDGGLNDDQAANLIDDNSIITYASQQLGHRHKTTTLRKYLNLTKLKLLKMSGAMRFDYLERRRRLADSALKHLEAKFAKLEERYSSATKFMKAESNGLIEALKDGDDSKALKLLKKHFLT